MAHEKPFLMFDVRDWNGFDTEKNEYLVEGREVGDEMGEDCWDSGHELGVYKADATYANEA